MLIVGGGINGAGIARDAAGRGLKVLLVEQDDLAGHTSSASTKLIHGGLRYLEHYAFRLVREALIERTRLLAIAPHIIRPLRFIMPLSGGHRPAWLIRLGLFLYDHLGARGPLPGSCRIRLDSPHGEGLKTRHGLAFAYSDCWVDDARLVVLNAVDAAEHGATVRVRTRFLGAEQHDSAWRARLVDTLSGTQSLVTARVIVNAAGPWVHKVLEGIPAITPERPPRLVKGSHIVIARRHEGEHAYIFQNPDGRIMFAIPYEQRFTLIGTTDTEFDGDPSTPCIDAGEIAYLCKHASRYLNHAVTPADVVHSFSGVRPLYDDGEKNVSAITRDYVLKLGTTTGPPLLSIFGGKITTYRRLAEQALEMLAPWLSDVGRPWTDSKPLPGGHMDGFDAFLQRLKTDRPFLPPELALRLARCYGTRAMKLLGDAHCMQDLGLHLGGGLTTREIDYLLAHEWAMTADDILWRRTKLGLHVTAATRDAIDHYVATRQ